MAMFIYEMEFFPGRLGGIVVRPCQEEFGGATSGTSIPDATESAADWLRMTIEDYLIRGVKPPVPTFCHQPVEPGGRIVTLAVEASLDAIPAVMSAEAAEMLGVSTARVSQMCKSGLLESWKSRGHRMVSLASIKARLQDKPRSGRPCTPPKTDGDLQRELVPAH